MSSDPDLHDAAFAWLDGIAADLPHRLLKDLLRDSPDTLPAFAALARAENLLRTAGESHAEGLQRASRLLDPPLMSRVRRLILRPAFYWSAAALLAVGTTWSFVSTRTATPSLPESRIAQTKVRAPLQVLTRTSPGVTKPAPADNEFVQRMDRFIVPEYSARGVLLAEALDELRKNVGSIDREAVPAFTAAPEVPDSTTVHLHLKYQSVAMLVKLISIQTGTTFRPSGKGYVISPDPKALPPDSVTKRHWEPGVLAAFFQQQGIQIQDAPPKDDNDAIKGNDSSSAWWTNQFTGILPGMFGEKTAEFHAATDFVVLNSSSRLDEMLQRLTTFGDKHPPGTWEWTTLVLYLKSAESQEAFEKIRTRAGAGASLPTGEVEGIVQQLSAMKNVETAPLSALTTRPGAIGRTFVGKESPDPVTKPDNWTGMKFQITNEPQGEHGGFSLKTIQQSIGNPDAADAPISVSEMSTKASVEDGRTRLYGGLISENEGETVVLLSAKRYTPPEDLPYGIPGGQPGMVQSPYAPEKGPVDVAGFKRGTKVKCPYTGKPFRVP